MNIFPFVKPNNWTIPHSEHTDGKGIDAMGDRENANLFHQHRLFLSSFFFGNANVLRIWSSAMAIKWFVVVVGLGVNHSMSRIFNEPQTHKSCFSLCRSFNVTVTASEEKMGKNERKYEKDVE